MSVVDYDIGRRYPRYNDLSFSGYYYQERDMPMKLAHGMRADPRGYHLGGPVGGPHGRLEVEQDEPSIDNGASRRRIAVAVSALFRPTFPSFVAEVRNLPSLCCILLLILVVVREVP
jgi:hypothetical protein